MKEGFGGGEIGSTRA